jgi:hypothetical protein
MAAHIVEFIYGGARTHYLFSAFVFLLSVGLFSSWLYTGWKDRLLSAFVVAATLPTLLVFFLQPLSASASTQSLSRLYAYNLIIIPQAVPMLVLLILFFINEASDRQIAPRASLVSWIVLSNVAGLGAMILLNDAFA